MASSTLFFKAVAVVVATMSIVPTASASIQTYQLTDDYSKDNFFNQFLFQTGDDPTHGYVDYKSQAAADALGLLSVGDSVKWGVDTVTDLTGVSSSAARGRASVRLESLKTYTTGLFIADIKHMPGNICGTWPAFWTAGLGDRTTTWPKWGEIDIIEGVNTASINQQAGHTDKAVNVGASSECLLDASQQTAGLTFTQAQCDVNVNFNAGCGTKNNIKTPNYGGDFNGGGGGVYAMEWTDDYIKLWNFPRGSIPVDITAGIPTPALWGPPTFNLGNQCEVSKYFQQHNIIFDTTFCGDWAGEQGVWANSGCKADSISASGAPTCESYVRSQPGQFSESYWDVNYVRVYNLKDAIPAGQLTTTSTSTTSSSTTTTSTSTSTTSSTTSTSTTSSTSSSTSMSTSTTDTNTSSSTTSTDSTTSTTSSSTSASTDVGTITSTSSSSTTDALSTTTSTSSPSSNTTGSSSSTTSSETTSLSTGVSTTNSTSSTTSTTSSSSTGTETSSATSDVSSTSSNLAEIALTTSTSTSVSSSSTTDTSFSTSITGGIFIEGPSSSPTSTTSQSIASSTTSQSTTSTVTTTQLITISSCAPTVQDCPYTTAPITTSTVVTYTTICPVTPAPTPSTPTIPTTTKSTSITEFTTSTIYTTKLITVTLCPKTVTNCPAESKTVVTSTYALYTTICPLSISPSPSPSPSAPSEKPHNTPYPSPNTPSKSISPPAYQSQPSTPSSSKGSSPSIVTIPVTIIPVPVPVTSSPPAPIASTPVAPSPVIPGPYSHSNGTISYPAVSASGTGMPSYTKPIGPSYTGGAASVIWNSVFITTSAIVITVAIALMV